MNKEVRQNVYKILKNKADKHIASEIICKKVADLEKFRKANTIFCYMSLNLEVDTTILIENALKQQKIVGVPISKETLQFIKIKENTQFITGAFGVREPVLGQKLDSCNIIIVPMVAFDSDCNRLGHGKGYYDKFLANNNCYKIGIAFSEQEQEFFVQGHDQPMDIIITEKDIFMKTII